MAHDAINMSANAISVDRCSGAKKVRLCAALAEKFDVITIEPYKLSTGRPAIFLKDESLSCLMCMSRSFAEEETLLSLNLKEFILFG